jgi:hypothetical protein
VWEKRGRSAQYPDWWIVDAPAALAAIDARRQGFVVEEVGGGGGSPGFNRHWAIRWMKGLAGYRPFSPLSPDR